jgi:hypothetical protein
MKGASQHHSVSPIHKPNAATVRLITSADKRQLFPVSIWTCRISQYKTWFSFSSWFSICEKAGSGGNTPEVYFVRTPNQPSLDVPGFLQSLHEYFVIIYGYVIVCYSYPLPLPVDSFVILRSLTQLTTHTRGGVVAEGEWRQLSDKIRTLYLKLGHGLFSIYPWKLITTLCTNWFMTNRSCRTLQNHRTFTHTLKPNKPVGPQLATSQRLQLHATHTKNC